MSIAPSPSPADATAEPDATSTAVAFDLSEHTALLQMLDGVAAALEAHDKRAAAAILLSMDRTMGLAWHPARHPLRGIESAVDIGRWELAARWLDDTRAWLNPDPQPDSEGL